MKKICKVILAAAAMVALAAPAMAANDKLIVKDSGGVNPAFRVQDNGYIESKSTHTGDVSLVDVYNNTKLRTKVRSSGIQEWYLSNIVGASETESGRIVYSLPGGGVGFGVFTGATYDQNRFDIVNYANNGMGVPGFVLAYNSTAGNWLTITGTGVAVGNTWNPRAELEVSGTLMINNTPSDGGAVVVKPTCAAGKDGALYYTQGGAGVASKLELCQKASGGTYSWVLIK